MLQKQFCFVFFPSIAKFKPLTCENSDSHKIFVLGQLHFFLSRSLGFQSPFVNDGLSVLESWYVLSNLLLGSSLSFLSERNYSNLKAFEERLCSAHKEEPQISEADTEEHSLGANDSDAVSKSSCCRQNRQASVETSV